jgi:L-fucose isomerase-like protein
MKECKVGFVGFGEVNSPRELIEEKCAGAIAALQVYGVDLVATAPVSDDQQGLDVKRAIEELSCGEFDSLVVCLAGWIPTYAVITVIDQYRHIPMVLWGLTGRYESGRLVTTADQAGTTALRKVMEDMGYMFRFVYNTPDAPVKAEKVFNFCCAASAAARLRNTKIGMMGYRDMNLYGTLFDATTLRGRLGIEIEVFEMLEMTQLAEGIHEDDIHTVVCGIKNEWCFMKEPQPGTLETGARYYLAIRRKAMERGYQSMSLIDVDGMKKLLKFPPSMIFMLLADKMGICVVPENDALGSVTQLIVKNLTGQIGAYLEFYEFMEDRVLAGVPDFVPAEVVDGPVTVHPTSFGGFAEGILNVSKVKTGRLTMFRLSFTGGRYVMHIVTGEGVCPRRWEEAGWLPPAPQLPSLEIVLDTPVEEFADKVLSQHYIICYGDHSQLMRDYCRITGIDLY